MCSSTCELGPKSVHRGGIQGVLWVVLLMHELELSPAAALQHYFEKKSHALLHGAAVPLLAVLPLLPQVEPAGGTWGPSSAQG